MWTVGAGAASGLEARRFAEEVAGLVYSDVPDIELTDAEADALGPGGRQAAFAPIALPSTVPAGVRAEIENITRNQQTEFAGARAARPAASIPSGAVISTQRAWNGDMPEIRAGVLRLVIKHQREWTMSTPKGLFVVASHVGHIVHRDDPELVIRLIRQLL